MKYAAQLFLGGVAALLAIAPIPFQKWALPRLAFGTLSIACFASAKHKVDIELDVQRDADVWAFNEAQQQKQLLQASNAIAFDGILKSEARRVQFQTEREMAHLQRDRAIVLEAEVPEYLDALEAQQRANLEAQTRSVASAPSDLEEIVISPTDSQLATVQAANPDLEFYDFNDLTDDAVGILVVGNSGSGKTSIGGKIACQLTENNPAQVFALDPHFNDIWEQLGIHALGEFAEIEEVLNLLVAELDARRTRKKFKQPLGDTILCFTDELNACLETTSEPEKYKTALQRLGSEGRKFGIMLIGLCQSSNVDDLGISGSMRANYFIVCVGQSARYQSRQAWKAGDPNREWITKQAYPCMVLDGGSPRLALHPTHHAYTVYKKNGNKPQNMGKVNQIPLTFLPKHLRPSVSTVSVALTEESTDISPITSVETQREQLDAVFNKPYSPAEYLLKEMSQQELDALIKKLRGEPDTSSSDVSNTLSHSGESDTSPSEYQGSEPLPRKAPLRIWKEGDFQRYLPKEDENDFFERLVEHQDTSANASDIIKDAWKLTRGEKYSLGRAAFVYLISKHGSDRQKQVYAPFVTKYVADVESEANKKLIEQTKGAEEENSDSLDA